MVSSFLTIVLLLLCRARSWTCSSLRCHWGMGVLSTAWQTQLRVKPTHQEHSWEDAVYRGWSTYIREDAHLLGEALGGDNAGSLISAQSGARQSGWERVHFLGQNLPRIPSLKRRIRIRRGGPCPTPVFTCLRLFVPVYSCRYLTSNYAVSMSKYAASNLTS